MQTSGSGKTQKRERKSIQKKRDNSKQTHHGTAIGIIGTYDREATGSVIRHRQNTGPHRTKRIPTRHDARQAIGISPIPEPATDKMQGKLQRQGRMAEEADKRQIPNGVLLQKEIAASRRTKISAYRTERNKTVRYSHGESGENIQRKKILSERLCIELRKMLKEVEGQLKENDKLVDKERKEKERQKKLIEEELLRAKRNAAW